MSSETFVLTQRGYTAIQKELAALEAELQERIAALEDIPVDTTGEDNPDTAARYDLITAKEDIERRINYAKRVLDRAEVHTEDPNPKLVDPGERVIVWNFVTNAEETFELLASPEAVRQREHGTDNTITAVSTESLIGQVLIGKQIGDVIEVEVPNGLAKYCVQRIERIEDV